MAHCLLIIEDPILQDIYSLNLKMYTDLDSIIKKTHYEAMSVFDHVDSVDLIIVQEKIDGVETADEMINFLKANDKSHIPVIMLGKERSIHYFANILPPKVDMSTLLKAVAKHMGVTARDIASRFVPEFFPIPVTFLENIEESNCEVFKRNADKDGKYMFYKVIEAGKKFTNKDILNIKKSGHRHVYIQSNLRLKFTNFYTRQVILKVRETKDPKKKVGLLQQAMDFVKTQSINEMPLSEETVEVANTYIEETLNMVGDSKALRYFMKNLLENTSGFAFQHCQLITYVSFQMVEAMDWGTKEQQKKLSFISFFHDIVLQEERLVKVHSTEEMNALNLDEQRKKVVEHHAYLASDIVSRIPNAPMGADIIIKQHHGAQNGIGFPKDFPSNLSPLAMVFMVAEEYVHYMLKNKADFSHEKAIKGLYDAFPKMGKWKRMIQTLEKMKI